MIINATHDSLKEFLMDSIASTTIKNNKINTFFTDTYMEWGPSQRDSNKG